MPNPYDVGSARLLQEMGFSALATTSAGLAATLGRLDMNVTQDELFEHVAGLAPATGLPLNVDSERCFSEDITGVAATVSALAELGAAGCSIEDWNPQLGFIDPIDVAAGRVRAAADGAAQSGLVLTARCENHLHGITDLDDTIARIQAYAASGADAIYTPGLTDLDQIEKVVKATPLPVNVLLMPGGPSVSELGARGVRRISVGSWLSRISHGAMVAAAQELTDQGTISKTNPFLNMSLAGRAWG